MKKMMMLAICLMAIVGVVSCGQMPISNSTFNSKLNETSWSREFQSEKAPYVEIEKEVKNPDGSLNYKEEAQTFLAQSSEVITFGKLDNKTNAGAYTKVTVLDAVVGNKTLDFPKKDGVAYSLKNSFLGLTKSSFGKAQKIVLPNAELFTEKVIETGTWTTEKTALNETVYKIVVTKTETVSKVATDAWVFDESASTNTLDAALIESEKVFSNSTSEETLFPGADNRANVAQEAIAYYVKKAENGKELILTDKSGVTKTFAIVSK